MKVASSLRFGGMIISPQDCTKDSYLSLGLCCPLCHQSVFWVQEAEKVSTFRRGKDGRKVFIKPHKIPAHFSHFKTVSKQQSELCENRAKNIKKADIKKSQAKAKAQRKKLFDERIRMLFNFNPRLSGLDYLLFLAEEDFLRNKGDRLYFKKFIRGLTIKAKAKKITVGKGIAEILTRLKEDRPEGLEFFPELSWASVKDSLNYLESPLEEKMHYQICYEALDYVFSAQNYGLLADLILFNYYFVKVVNTYPFSEEEDKPVFDSLADLEDHSFLTTFSRSFNRGTYLSLPDSIGNANFAKLGLELSIFLANPDYDKVFRETIEEGMLIYLAAAIALTPWADAFSYFDRSLAKPIEVSQIVGFVAIDGTKSDGAKINFFPVNRNVSSEPPFSFKTFPRQGQKEYKSFVPKYADYSLNLVGDTVTEKEKESWRFKLEFFYKGSMVAEVGGWTSLEVKRKKDAFAYRVKKDYPDLDNECFEQLFKQPCLIFSFYKKEHYQEIATIAFSFMDQLLSHFNYCLTTQEIE